MELDDGEHLLPADPVTERTEHQTAERTHDERSREDGEGVQQRRRVVPGGEEVGGDEGGEEAVDREVVPLDGIADRRTADHPTHVKSID